MKHRAICILLTVFLILIASTVWYCLFTQEHDNVSDDYIAIVGDEATYKHLLSLQGDESIMRYETASDSAMEANGMTEYSDVSKGNASEFSATNNQIATVDEGDIIKTNGRYICALNQQKVTVVRVQSDGAMKKESTIDIASESGECGVTLYLTEEELIVITQDFGGISTLSDTAKADDTIITTDTPADRRYGVTIAIYPIADTVSTEPNRTITMEGHYLTSRLSNDCLYMITETYPNDETQTTEDSLPQYRDSFTGEKALSVEYDSIYYCPRDPAPGRQMTHIGALSLKGEHEINVQSFLGGGNEFYMNEDALYLALNQYGWMEQTEKTALCRFDIDKDQVTPTATGEVPGIMINQFAMDEFDGIFRIATTQTTNGVTVNSVYLFNKDLNTVGSLTDLAEGESIYAVRFMGDRAYLVTFQQVDPLFVLDLSDAVHPKVLGELKIPGYSQYLHPYDETTLIGIGKDAVSVPLRGSEGSEGAEESMTYDQGLKISLFDVADVANPKELDSLTIGGRGTDSEALGNHKAFYFDHEKGILSIPITVYTPKTNGTPDEYGEWSNQGQYFFAIDGETIKETSVVSHCDNANNYEYFTSRTLRISDTVYVLSEKRITAHHRDGNEILSELDL